MAPTNRNIREGRASMEERNAADPIGFARAQLAAGADALAETASMAEAIDSLATRWIECLRAGGKILFFGNGGSQADSQHLAGELVNRFRFDRAASPGIALGSSAPVLTSIANDDCYDHVFRREVEAFGASGDLAIGFSTSGSSRNVVLALEAARARGMTAIAFTGRRGGAVAEAADVAFRAPSDDTPIIQQVHMAVGHVLCDIAERALFGDGSTSA